MAQQNHSESTFEDERRARREAEEALQRRDELIALVTHDLRNPLNTISMSCALLVDDVGDTGRDVVGRIQRSVVRMERLLTDVLDLMRIDGGGLRLERVSLSANDLVDSVRSSLADQAAAKKQSLESSPGPASLRVMVDRARIVQALTAVAGNAIKFTPEGGRITLGVSERDGKALFEVRDTGPGIPVAELPHIFERHRQTNRKRGAGLALGLAIAAGVVRAHGGEIGVSSTPGEGSTFWMTVPVA